ncbi:MAG: hypothetical protein WBC44_18500 [Planctomycetaceae bacterium]
MLPSLSDRFDELRQRLRWAGVIRGAALVVIVAVAAATLAGSVDALTRSGSTLWRLLLTAAAVVPIVWTVAVILIPPLRSRPSDVELARRVERRDASWGGRLSAAAAFQNVTPTAGSPELQREVVTEISRQFADRALPDLVDRSRVTRPVLLAAGTIVVALLIAALSPSATGTAISRLALPFAAIEWPRNVDLHLLAETGEPLGSRIQIGRGQTLRFTVRNAHGDVPDDLALQLVSPDGARRSEPVPVVEETSGEGTLRTVGSGVLLADEGPLRFRVVGGDHRDMPFLTAEVVPPPVFDRLQVSVTPPDYLGMKAAPAPEGVGSVNGVVGSSITVKARSNKPLAAAELRVGDKPGPRVALSDDGRDVAATFTLTEPGYSSYWFRLQDRGGFENPQAPRYELRITADAVPEVTIAEPPDDLTATAVADLPIVVEASDDHGLLAARLRFARGGFPSGDSADPGSDGMTIPLFDGPDRPAEGSFPLIWSLEPLRLTSGERLVFHAEATDAFNLGPPHVGMSAPRTVTIVSAAEKREEILDLQSGLLDDLAQARRDETRLRNAVDSLLTQWEGTGELRPADRDRLAHLELEQRQIAAKLTDPQQGFQRQAARARSELAVNRVEDAELSERLERIAQELAVLRDDALPAADRDLTAARKAADDEGAASLAGARTNLDTILGGLDSLLQDLGAWRDRRDLDSEMSDLLGMQRELTDETARTASETLGTSAGQLTEQQQTTLQRLGLRQHGLADRLSRFEKTVEQIAEGKPSDSDDADAAASAPGDPQLKDVADTLKEAGLPAMARAAGESIRANDLGEAGRMQQDLVDRLRELQKSLSQPNDGGQNAASLEAAANKIDELSNAQQELLETLQKARKTPDGLSDEERERLTREQAALREAVSEAGRQLRAAGGNDAAKATGEAARRMSDGLERLMRHDDAAAERSLEQALAELERAKQEAAREAERLGEQLAQELVESSRDMLEALVERQEAINREIGRLERMRAAQERRSRSQLLTLRKTAEAQAAVASTTDSLADELKAAQAVSFTLRSAAERMRLLEAALHRKETDENSQRHGEAAKSRLEQIVAALQATSNAASDSSTGEPGAESASGPPGEVIPMTVQLQLVKTLQEELLRRTTKLDETSADGRTSETYREELERLGEEQASLTALVRNLLSLSSPPSDEVTE